MKTAKAIGLAVLSILLILSTLISSASGITGNYYPDSNPYVGIIVFFSDEARQQPISYGTGILVSPTVMLTAGHSTFGAAAASVCFDKGPIGYSIENGKIVYKGNQPIYNGTPKTYPEYELNLMAGGTKGNKVFSISDLGAVILDEPVGGLTNFPSLPPEGIVDTLPVNTELKVIGYGVQYQLTPKNNGPKNSWTGTLSSNSAKVNLLSGNFAGSDKYLKCTANPGQDKGGIAFGDSGGPVLYSAIGTSESLILGINAYVTNANCAGVTYHTRIDTPQTQQWITFIGGPSLS